MDLEIAHCEDLQRQKHAEEEPAKIKQLADVIKGVHGGQVAAAIIEEMREKVRAEVEVELREKIGPSSRLKRKPNRNRWWRLGYLVSIHWYSPSRQCLVSPQCLVSSLASYSVVHRLCLSHHWRNPLSLAYNKCL